MVKRKFFFSSGRLSNRRSSVSTQASNISDSCDLKSLLEPRLTHGLLDFIGMLWLIHGKTLQKKENKERQEELYRHGEKCLPEIFRNFRVSSS